MSMPRPRDTAPSATICRAAKYRFHGTVMSTTIHVSAAVAAPMESNAPGATPAIRHRIGHSPLILHLWCRESPGSAPLWVAPQLQDQRDVRKSDLGSQSVSVAKVGLDVGTGRVGEHVPQFCF